VVLAALAAIAQDDLQGRWALRYASESLWQIGQHSLSRSVSRRSHPTPVAEGMCTGAAVWLRVLTSRGPPIRSAGRGRAGCGRLVLLAGGAAADFCVATDGVAHAAGAARHGLDLTLAQILFDHVLVGHGRRGHASLAMRDRCR
jgi:hypothetical protein